MQKRKKKKEKKELTSPILEISWEVSLIFKLPSFIFRCTKFWMFSTRSSRALHFFSAFSASGPVSATILRIPLEMASSDTRTNDFMCPVRCRCLVWMSKENNKFIQWSLFVLPSISHHSLWLAPVQHVLTNYKGFVSSTNPVQNQDNSPFAWRVFFPRLNRYRL